MKKFILGFLCAAMLFTAIPIGAAIQEYALKLSAAKIVVDGSEFKDEKLPVLYLDPGYNYIPAAVFRSICDKIGVGFEYDSATKEIQIDTKAATVNSDTLTTTETDTGGDTVSDKITQTPDGITEFVTFEGKQYIGFIAIRNKLKESGYDFISTVDTIWKVIKGEEVILDDIATIRPFGFDMIEADYYISIISPLIK